MAPIPITIITGFLGSGKTTLILNLVPQLPPTYRLALLKNEYGDLAVDSQLANAKSISGVRELLNGCICCNLVGQLGDALETLRRDIRPDRIVVETSGSAFPATLAMEVNRLARETGHYVLDGVVTVIDVENWKGYNDTSYTAKLQAKYTDLIVMNKWEAVGERRYDECLDRIGDLELQVATVKSDRGKVDQGLLLGLDGALARDLEREVSVGSHASAAAAATTTTTSTAGHEHGHEHAHDHQSEVEVLSATLLPGNDDTASVDLEALEMFLLSAPKDEIYRIKAILATSGSPTDSDGSKSAAPSQRQGSIRRYILNWAFGRWTFTPTKIDSDIVALDRVNSLIADTGEQADQPRAGEPEPLLRMTIIAARFESEKWKKRILSENLLCAVGSTEGGRKIDISRVL
ncbi:hypothetical protein MMC25_006284 [Agyrium rufum]|nr:hypothetical protein [Agyrium rufum]